MPNRCGSNKASRAGSGDPFHALPDAVLSHLLGFLPALDAVRTSALARRWRTLWRSAPRLRVVDVEALESVWMLNSFMTGVLVHRGPNSCPLDESEFDLCGFNQLLKLACVDQWMRHALIANVRVLQVRLFAAERVELADWPLLSSHLIRLELEGVCLIGSFPDFSGCSVLEDLKITNCQIGTDNILSPSLKHLKIIGCELYWQNLPTHISAPNLISLQLDDYVGVTPILGSMPLLETASVKLGHNNEEVCEFCDQGESGECACDMCMIYYTNNRRNDVSVLLGGLLNASYLELKASPTLVTFRRHLRYRPIFNKLKTLLLNDCCLVDLSTLVCILLYAPNLQELIVQLCEEPKPALEMEDTNLMEKSLMLQQLKVVKVKYHIIDERVYKILKILHSCGFKEITVQEV